MDDLMSDNDYFSDYVSTDDIVRGFLFNCNGLYNDFGPGGGPSTCVQFGISGELFEVYDEYMPLVTAARERLIALDMLKAASELKSDGIDEFCHLFGVPKETAMEIARSPYPVQTAFRFLGIGDRIHVSDEYEDLVADDNGFPADIRRIQRNNLCSRVKNMRRRLHMTVSELAEKAGISEHLLEKIEDYWETPVVPKDVVEALAHALGSTTDRLWGDSFESIFSFANGDGPYPECDWEWKKPDSPFYENPDLHEDVSGLKLGTKIEQSRKKIGMLRSELSMRTGIPEWDLELMEENRLEIGDDSLKKIVEILDLSMEDDEKRVY